MPCPENNDGLSSNSIIIVADDVETSRLSQYTNGQLTSTRHQFDDESIQKLIQIMSSKEALWNSMMPVSERTKPIKDMLWAEVEFELESMETFY